MDQDSTGKGSGGDRRNWRERLGINKDLPRLSEEFKTDGPAQRAEPQLGKDARAAQRPPSPNGPAAQASTPGGQRPGAQVVRPAPMAPRPAGRVAPMAPRPAAQPEQAAAPAPATPTAPAPRQAPTETARPVNPAAAPQRPTPSLATAERSDRFAERLREQREAAERLARQRMEQARAQAQSAQQKSAPAPSGNEENPKFTFAREEIVQAQRESEPAPSTPRPAPPPAHGYQPPAQPYGRVPPPAYQPSGYQPGAFQPGGYQARPYPQDQGTPQPYRGPAPARNWQGEPPAADEAGAPVADEYEDERAAPRGPRGQVAQRPRARAYAEDDLDDVFDEEERAPRRGGRARAEDYSAAYQGYEDEFEEEDEPRSRGGPLVLLLALIAAALIAGGLVYWYFSQHQQASKQSNNVPVITAPKEPAKTVPQASNQQQATETPSQLPVRHKKIYDRILGDETLEPERIVPTEETPKTPVPSQNQNGNVQNNGTKPQQSIDQLPLPLPPPPEPNGQQGRLDVPQTTGKSEPDQMLARNETLIAKPAAETTVSDLSVAKSDPQPQSAMQDLKVPEVPTAEAAQKQVEVAAKQADVAAQTPTQQPVANSDQQQLQQIIETDQPPAPKPAPKPQKPKLAAKPKPQVQQRVAVAPPPPQPQVQQPLPQGQGPIALTPFNSPAAEFTPQQQPQQNVAAQQPDTSTETTTRFHGRNSDPLAGKRVPFSSSLPQSNLSTQQPADLMLPNQQAPQPIVQPQPQQQEQVASIQPAPQPQPQPRQPSAASGYVVQLAAFRSQADAQNEYQRMAQAHARLLHGLSPRIQEASLGASGSFFRLSVGTLPSAEAAQKLCNALISAGERDCLVRRQ